MMINLPIVQTAFNGENLPTINARNLYDALDVSTKFTQWIERRIENYGFVEGVEFFPTLGKTSSFLGGRPKTEYFLTLDMAKHIALMENNAKGRDIRNQLIEAERQLREEVPALVRSLQQEKHELLALVDAQQENSQLKQFALGEQKAAKDIEQKYIALLEETLTLVKKEQAQTQAYTRTSRAVSACKPGVKLSDEEKRTIVRLKQGGMRICDIARQLSRSTSSVDTVLRAYRAQGGNA